MVSSEQVFRGTLRQLESGLTVQLVAETQLRMFDLIEPAQNALHVMNEFDFSQAPVTSKGEVVGVVDRDVPSTGQTVADWMQPLTSSMMMSAQTNLRDSIRILARSSRRYRLILSDAGVSGILTRSDLQKLPVRLLAFSYVTHLESVLAETIERRSTGDDWVQYLESWDKSLGDLAASAASAGIGSEAIRRLRSNQTRNEKFDIVPSLLEVTEFPQKWYVVCRMMNLGEEFASELAGIQRHLRNSVAHSRNYVASNSHLEQLDRRLGLCEKWIDFLSNASNLPHVVPAAASPHSSAH